MPVHRIRRHVSEGADRLLVRRGNRSVKLIPRAQLAQY